MVKISDIPVSAFAVYNKVNKQIVKTQTSSKQKFKQTNKNNKQKNNKFKVGKSDVNIKLSSKLKNKQAKNGKTKEVVNKSDQHIKDEKNNFEFQVESKKRKDNERRKNKFEESNKKDKEIKREFEVKNNKTTVDENHENEIEECNKKEKKIKFTHQLENNKTKKNENPENKLEKSETSLKVDNVSKKITKKLKSNTEQQKLKLSKKSPQNVAKKLIIDNFNSVKSGQDIFHWLMSPVGLAKFFKNNWEKQPIIIKRNNPNYYSNLLSSEEINHALRTQQFFFTKNIDITSYSPINGIRETHNPPGRATAPLVWDFYANGCSIRILNPQTFFPKIHALNASLQEYFGCFVGANVYLTPADSQGFAPHFDDIEAFVIQLEGEKKWKLYAPRSENETLPRYSSGNFTEVDLGAPIQEVLLQPGDLMYFPRGYIHQGAALEDKHSLHITLSVYQKNSWADLLETLLPATLKSAIEEDVSFREGLPLQYLSHMGLVHSDENSEFRNNFLMKLHSLMGKLVNYAPVDAAVDQLGKKFIHDSLPPFLREEERETTVFGDGENIKNGVVHHQAEMSLDTRIKLVRYNCVRIVREDETIKIYYSISNSKEYHGEEPQFLEIDEDLAPAIDALISVYPEYIAVEDLPVQDEIAKVQIASDLWENGIVMTEQILSYLSTEEED